MQFLLISLFVVTAIEAFLYRDCGQEDRLIEINDLDVLPKPLKITGPINLTTKINLKKDINRSFKVQIKAKRIFKIFGVPINFPIPCIGNLGSCTYNNFCDEMSRVHTEEGNQCPFELPDHIPCLCPISQGEYHLNNHQYSIKKDLGILAYLASGSYEVETIFTDPETNQQIGCLWIAAELKV